MSLPSMEEFSPFGKNSGTLSKHFIDVMRGEMTRAGSLSFRIVSFQALDGSKDPYGTTSGMPLSLNSLRI